MKRIVLTMAAVMALLVPPLARATDVAGILDNLSSPTLIDSVLWYTPGSETPIPEVTPNWGGETPMTDTFQFQPLGEWPSKVQLFFNVGGGPGECIIEPLERDMWYTLPTVLGSQVVFKEAVLVGIAERPGNVTPGLAASAALRISPNPLAGGFATLSFTRPLDHSTTGPLLLSIYNVSGQTVLSRALSVGREASSVVLDLRHLSNGVYLVKLSSEGFASSQKLVVQR